MISKNAPDFEGAIKRAKNARLVNVALCAILMTAAAVGGVLSLFTDYRLFGMSTAGVLVAISVALIIKNLKEANATQSVAKYSIYAAVLTPAQARTICRHQMRRGQLFYITAMLVAVIPASIALLVLYFLTQSVTYLIFMAAFALCCLAVALLSILYLRARLTVRDNICLVSGRGIIIGREILPFSAKNRETQVLYKFADYYCLQYIKSSIFGIKSLSEVIFPVNGAVRSGIVGKPDDVLIVAFGLEGIFITEDEFYESRDYLSNQDDDAPGAEEPPSPAGPLPDSAADGQPLGNLE